MKKSLGVAVAIMFLSPHNSRAEEGSNPSLETLALIGATSDYVYRGLSLSDEDPTPFAYVEARYGIAYINGLIVGTYLGEDGLGRDLGNIEADATIGVSPHAANFEFDLGIKYTGYPNGRDLIAGTLDKAERDFVEPFAKATMNVSEQLAIGGTVFWTPDFYYESGPVLTLEGRIALVLPQWNAASMKFDVSAGRVRSEEPDAAAPGYGYVYWNAGLEGRLERLFCDLRYWDTDVEDIDEFGRRVVLTFGMAIN